MTFWEELAWEAGCTVAMVVTALLCAWKAEGYISMSRSPENAYRLYGRVGTIFLVLGAVALPLGFVFKEDVGQQLIFWIGGSWIILIGGWLFFFRRKRFPERRWESNVIEKPPDDPMLPR